jgi:hypothetical protein
MPANVSDLVQIEHENDFSYFLFFFAANDSLMVRTLLKIRVVIFIKFKDRMHVCFALGKILHEFF